MFLSFLVGAMLWGASDLGGGGAPHSFTYSFEHPFDWLMSIMHPIRVSCNQGTRFVDTISSPTPMERRRVIEL